MTEAGEWQGGVPWRLVHERSIGQVEGNGPEVFTSIADVEIDGVGNIYVLDRESNELRIFDSSAKHIGTTGRSGRGPGEFNRPNGLRWIPGTDSLLVIDGSGGRYSVLDHGGTFIRSAVRPLSSHAYAFRGGFAQGSFYEEGLPLHTTRSDPVLFAMRLESLDRVVDTLTFLKLPVDHVPTFSVRNERGGMNLEIPFVPKHTWDFSNDGTIWWGFGSQYHLVEFNLKGDTLRTITNERSPAPVMADDLQKWERSVYTARFRERGGVIDTDRIPEVKPFFTELFFDSEGYLWVEVPATDDLATFDIFDAKGRFLGQLRTGVARWPYVKPRVRNGKLYFVGIDDMNVQSVHVFKIGRDGR